MYIYICINAFYDQSAFIINGSSTESGKQNATLSPNKY